MADLTYNLAHQLFDYKPETGVLRWKIFRSRRFAGDIAGSVNKDGYRQVKYDYKTYLAHRVAFLLMTGEWPTRALDHINGDPLDNRWANLRECWPDENAWNTTHVHNSTGFRGVVRQRKWFVARIGYRNSVLFLGRFKTAEEAHAAYVAEAKKLYGEFAPTRLLG